MAVVHVFVTVLALVAMACLPGLIAVIVVVDDACDAVGRGVRRARRRWARHRSVRRTVAQVGELPLPEDLATAQPTHPPIERIAADLRRLRRQRTGLATRSAVWQSAIDNAYDDRLSLGCRVLGVDEYLGELTGLDREIERVRLEGLLQEAGLIHRDVDAGWRPDAR
ncbi:MAG TPA: hypothetical protein VF054_17105 [Micromonosporaceae bacterium]